MSPLYYRLFECVSVCRLSSHEQAIHHHCPSYQRTLAEAERQRKRERKRRRYTVDNKTAATDAPQVDAASLHKQTTFGENFCNCSKKLHFLRFFVIQLLPDKLYSFTHTF